MFVFTPWWNFRMHIWKDSEKYWFVLITIFSFTKWKIFQRMFYRHIYRQICLCVCVFVWFHTQIWNFNFVKNMPKWWCIICYNYTDFFENNSTLLKVKQQDHISSLDFLMVGELRVFKISELSRCKLNFWSTILFSLI